jgi:hypothetical protein
VAQKMGRPSGRRLAERARDPDLRYMQLAEDHFASSEPNRIAKEDLRAVAAIEERTWYIRFETVRGLDYRKNESVPQIIRERGFVVYEGSTRYPEAVHEVGLRRVVVSSTSADTSNVLVAAGIDY